MESLRAKTRKPTHPGAILREDILPELGLSRCEFAKRLGISSRMLSDLLHERRSLTPDIAIRLGRCLGTTARSWLNMQQAVDLWELEHQHQDEYDLIKKVAHPPLPLLGKVGSVPCDPSASSGHHSGGAYSPL